jgi:hypothetical protein
VKFEMTAIGWPSGALRSQANTEFLLSSTISH